MVGRTVFGELRRSRLLPVTTPPGTNEVRMTKVKDTDTTPDTIKGPAERSFMPEFVGFVRGMALECCYSDKTVDDLGQAIRGGRRQYHTLCLPREERRDRDLLHRPRHGRSLRYRSRHRRPLQHAARRHLSRGGRFLRVLGEAVNEDHEEGGQEHRVQAKLQQEHPHLHSIPRPGRDEAVEGGA